MIVFADTLTGGTIAGGIALAVILVCCLIWAIGWWLVDEPALGIVGALIVAAISVGIWFWAMWPFAYEYHHWIDKEGEVARVTKRLVPNGDSGMQEKIVIQMANDRGIYGITETRAALLRAGDTVHIKCKKAYDFGVPRSSHGWDCKWVDGNIRAEFGF